MSRPMRAAGFGLLGVAAIATVIGTASAISSDEPSGDTAAPTSPAEPTPSEPDATPGEDTETPAEDGDGDGDEEPDDEETTPGDEDGDQEDPADGDGSGDGTARPGDKGLDPEAQRTPVRVFNNSNISGLATRAAGDLQDAGWNVTGHGNYSDGRIPASTVYFREGTAEESVAERIGFEFGMRIEPRFDGIKDSSPGVIVIVTKDYAESGKDN
ncbi:LytR C-terminal domain-containing protein [Haloechinothrix alba]|nr:LytR C-terminal domain-containing protein [Haloechinothrix alba]